MCVCCQGSGNSNNVSCNPQPGTTESGDSEAGKDVEVRDLLDKEIELTVEFKHNYIYWLKEEVFDRQVDWELLLECTDTFDL